MKKILLTAALVLSGLGLQAQTLNVYTGDVVTAVKASPDEMIYSESGTQLTMVGKTFAISDIDSMVIDNSTVDDNTVSVTYSGTSARVVIAGNVARYLSATVNGGHVAIVQSEDLPAEVSYTLHGAATNGSFWMDGKLKASLVLNGVSIACADSAAINIRNGKRISVQLVDGTTSTLSDGAGGAQKACFVIKGHAEFKGGGTLNLTGNAKHAFASNEYTELKKSTGTINILKAVTDGMNISQYLEMKGGTLNINNVGDDGIQVDATDDATDELNGQCFIKGGTLNIEVTADDAKGLKVADSLFVTGGTTTIKATGAGGKGIKGDAAIIIDDGVINVTTTGSTLGSSSGGGNWGGWGGWDDSSSSSKPKGIRAAGNLFINGGTVTVSTTGGEGAEGIESKAELAITGGDIVVNSYDDCINAATKITVSGGRVYACSTGNDAIDSNGTLYISGGLVIAAGTREPEGSFDCDQNTFSVTGGTLIGFGGDCSTPTTSVTTQPVVVQSKSLTQGQYLALSDANGLAYWAVRVPQTYSSCKLFISSPQMSVGSSYTLTTNVTKTGGTEWQGYTEDASISGGSSSSFTVSQMVTTSGGNDGGRPGGGGGPGGGGWH